MDASEKRRIPPMLSSEPVDEDTASRSIGFQRIIPHATVMENPSPITGAAMGASGLMPDTWIRDAAHNGMIAPFVEKQKRDGAISYGLSSYGYDARCSDEFMIFTNVDNAIVDPKDFSHQSFVERKTPVCVIPPNSFVLTRTVEYFKIPDDVLVICLGKSTYARCGLIVNVTPLEPGWEGHVTLEISNTTPLACESLCK